MRRRLGSALRLAEVRLRLPMVLAITAVVVGRWDDLRNRWDRWTRGPRPGTIVGQPVSADTEYFCPMDPGVVSDWPNRCGVCNMALVRRKKGDAVLLPDGVVARMQLSPYRVQLAGIRTEPAAFRPLALECETSGVVERRGDETTVAVEVPPRPGTWIQEGSAAVVRCADLPGRAPMAGRVSAVAGEDGGRNWKVATVRIDGPPPELRGGAVASVTFTRPVASLEPFRSMPRNPPAPAAGEPRRLYACRDHADSTAVAPGRCSMDGKDCVPVDLTDLERVRWWCPMHPAVTADRPGASCRECGGMELRPRIVAYLPDGQVLAVPQSAVVDTGDRTVVYVEGMPGMFDGVEVVLGERCGDFYPVVRGLEPGQQVAISGAFLLDAETRLNPGLAAGYFGAGGARQVVATSAAGSEEPRITRMDTNRESASRDGAGGRPGQGIGRWSADGLDGLGPEDRSNAGRQVVCPVTGLTLGSMGTPVKEIVSGRDVFLCCSGCRAKLLAKPDRYLGKLREATGSGSGPIRKEDGERSRDAGRADLRRGRQENEP